MLCPLEFIAEGDPKAPEYADPLHSISSTVDGGMNVLFSEIHDQLHGFANTEKGFVLLIPLCQQSRLFSVGHLIIVSDQAHDVSVISKLDDGTVSGHAVMCEQGVQQWTQNASLRSASVEEVSLPIHTCCGLLVRTSRTQLLRVAPRHISFSVILAGMTILSTKL